MSEKLLNVQPAVAEHMTAIQRLFKPGARITVLVRRDGAPDQDFMMTDDDPSEVIALIERRRLGSAA